MIDDRIVVGVDMKNWSRVTDRLNRSELRRAAQEKRARLHELFPGKATHAVYVNLHGAYKLVVDAPNAAASSSCRSTWKAEATLPDGFPMRI